MASKRRYKWDQNLIYDQYYTSALKGSQILSGLDDYHGLVLWTKQSLGWKKLELTGDTKGLFKSLPALIPALRGRLKVLADSFELYKTQCRREGKEIPEAPAPDQLREKFMAEALLDIHLEELDKLDKMIEDFVQEEVKVNNTNILKFGPKGMGTLRNGLLVEIDGQKTDVSDDRTVFISEPSSRYDGLSTADYYTKVVKPYRLACAKAMQETETKIANQELDASKVPQGKIRGTNVPWPDWPENCHNYKEPEESSAGGRRRLKK